MRNLKNLAKVSDSTGIKIAVTLVIALVGINSIFVYDKVIEFNEIKDFTADLIAFEAEIDMIFEAVQKSDLGMRGFFINPEDKMLQPHREAIEDQKASLVTLTNLFEKYGLETDSLKEFMGHVKEYIQLNDKLIESIHNDDLQYVESVVSKDPGYDLWIRYTKFIPAVNAFLDQKRAESEKAYQKNIIKTAFVQIIILLIGIPVLLVIMKKVNKTAKNRTALFALIDRSNRSYLFDDGKTIDINEEEAVTGSMQRNLQEASDFIKGIANGDFTVQWSGLNDDLMEFNTENLAGNLVRMRQQMAKSKLEDERNLWSVNGMAKFAEIIRENVHNMGQYADNIIASLVKYMDMNQGAFFVVNDDGNALELKGCFAFDRKKYIDKSISKGQGLAGQCWQEAELLYLKEIPDDYLRITSGLGEATPTHLILSPVMSDEKVLGVIEMASFHAIPTYMQEFLTKVCDAVGASLSAIKLNEQTSQLLRESREMSEQLKSQEEELLQNSEELQATQEEMKRKLDEAEEKLNAVEIITGKIELDKNGRWLQTQSV